MGSLRDYNLGKHKAQGGSKEHQPHTFRVFPPRDTDTTAFQTPENLISQVHQNQMAGLSSYAKEKERWCHFKKGARKNRQRKTEKYIT